MKKATIFILFISLLAISTIAITQTQFLNLDLDNVQTKGKYLGATIDRQSNMIRFRYQYQILDDNLNVINKTGYFQEDIVDIRNCIEQTNLTYCKEYYKPMVLASFWDSYNHDLALLKLKQEAMKADVETFDVTIGDSEIER